jgi:nucleotide-binding universal stress UspA family protein
VLRRSHLPVMDADRPFDSVRSGIATEEAHPHPRGEFESILVAVDGGAQGRDALEWAAAEAAVRNMPLRIMHAIRCPYDVTELPWGTSALPWGPSAECAGAAVADEALARAQAIAPTVPITAHLLVGGTVESIVREGRQDALIVVGRRVARLGSAGRSVGGQVPRKAKSPVVMVALSGEGGTPRGAGGRVAVTVGDTKDPLIALEFAFRAASLRDVGVVVFWREALCFLPPGGAVGGVPSPGPTIIPCRRGGQVSRCPAQCPSSARRNARSGIGSGWIKNQDRFASETARFDEQWLHWVCCPVAIVADRPRRRRTVADAARAQPSIGRLSRRLTASRSGRTARGF